MATTLVQSTSGSSSNSGPNINFDQAIEKLVPYRVSLTLISLLVSYVLGRNWTMNRTCFEQGW